MSLISAVRRRYHPLHGLMAARDYRRVLAAPPMRAGDARVLGEPIRYSDNHGLLHSVREIFQDEVYRFEAKTDAPHIIDAAWRDSISSGMGNTKRSCARIPVENPPCVGTPSEWTAFWGEGDQSW